MDGYPFNYRRRERYNQINELHSRLSESENTIQCLRSERRNLCWEVDNLQAQLSDADRPAYQIGFTFANILWNTLKSDDALESLCGSDLSELVNLSGKVIGKFVSPPLTASTSFSGVQFPRKLDPRNDSSDESRFVTSLVGCLTNIAARETGRAELMSNKDIAKLIQAVVQLVGYLQPQDFLTAKGFGVMLLFNLSLLPNSAGILTQHFEELLMSTIAWLELKDIDKELKINSCKLVHSVAICISDVRILNSIPKITFEKVKQSCHNEELTFVIETLLSYLDQKTAHEYEQ
ncbi:heat shock factor 2-binding protein-like [Convolutriloba macropyga]|uniref:heat shock factor 2-binding protein-like n=1 Tax=Convolutriloba macropyga TaxID=536237 RepID=UPI003F51AE83